MSADLTNFPFQDKKASLVHSAIATDHPSALGTRCEAFLADSIGADAARFDAVITVILAAMFAGGCLFVSAVCGLALRALPAVTRTDCSLAL